MWDNLRFDVVVVSAFCHSCHLLTHTSHWRFGRHPVRGSSRPAGHAMLCNDPRPIQTRLQTGQLVVGEGWRVLADRPRYVAYISVMVVVVSGHKNTSLLKMGAFNKEDVVYLLC